MTRFLRMSDVQCHVFNVKFARTYSVVLPSKISMCRYSYIALTNQQA
jgi:hypothetical protein